MQYGKQQVGVEDVQEAGRPEDKATTHHPRVTPRPPWLSGRHRLPRGAAFSNLVTLITNLHLPPAVP